MRLQHFCQKTVLLNRMYNFHGYIEQPGIYPIYTYTYGNLSITGEELKAKAELVNKAVLNIAEGRYEGNLQDILDAIDYLKELYTKNNIRKNRENFVILEPSIKVLDTLYQVVRESLNEITPLEKLSGLRLQLFQAFASNSSSVINPFNLATKPDGDGSYNNFWKRRQITQIYSDLITYIQSGKKPEAVVNLVHYANSDSDFRHYSLASYKTDIQRLIRISPLLEYKNTLTKELEGYLAINPTRKRYKLEQINHIFKALERDDLEEAQQAINRFKDDDKANKGITLGFFTLKKSRATQMITKLEEAISRSENPMRNPW